MSTIPSPDAAGSTAGRAVLAGRARSHLSPGPAPPWRLVPPCIYPASAPTWPARPGPDRISTGHTSSKLISFIIYTANRMRLLLLIVGDDLFVFSIIFGIRPEDKTLLSRSGDGGGRPWSSPVPAGPSRVVVRSLCPCLLGSFPVAWSIGVRLSTVPVDSFIPSHVRVSAAYINLYQLLRLEADEDWQMRIITRRVSLIAFVCHVCHSYQATSLLPARHAKLQN